MHRYFKRSSSRPSRRTREGEAQNRPIYILGAVEMGGFCLATQWPSSHHRKSIFPLYFIYFHSFLKTQSWNLNLADDGDTSGWASLRNNVAWPLKRRHIYPNKCKMFLIIFSKIFLKMLIFSPKIFREFHLQETILFRRWNYQIFQNVSIGKK